MSVQEQVQQQVRERMHTHIECGHLQGREDVVTRFAQAVQFVNRSTLGVHVFQL